MKIIFAVFIFVTVAAHADARKRCYPLEIKVVEDSLVEPPAPTCGKNEVYSDCGGSPCQGTCKNPNLSESCEAPCKPGCGCDEDHYRDVDGKCVHIKNCSVHMECGDNEEYKPCSPICGEPSCENRRAFYCGLGCTPDCYCKKGYIRDANNKCIKTEECPAKKPPQLAD